MNGYELWDTASHDLLAADTGEERLLAVVRAYHEQYGRDLVFRWELVALAANDDDDDMIIARGDELIARAFARQAAPT